MTSIYALHGFFGDSSDFAFLQNHFSVSAPSLFSTSQEIVPTLHLVQNLIDLISSTSPTPSLFLGYSMGARLGVMMHAKYPELFKHWIFIAPHPGFTSELDRTRRKIADEMWAEKFSAMPWKHLVSEWEAQEIFQASSRIDRSEDHFSREALSFVMKNFSSANASPEMFQAAARAEEVSIMVGERDSKFLGFYQAFTVRNLISIPNAGHRVLHDNPTSVNDYLIKLTHPL